MQLPGSFKIDQGATLEWDRRIRRCLECEFWAKKRIFGDIEERDERVDVDTRSKPKIPIPIPIPITDSVVR